MMQQDAARRKTNALAATKSWEVTWDQTADAHFSFAFSLRVADRVTVPAQDSCLPHTADAVASQSMPRSATEPPPETNQMQDPHWVEPS